VQVLQWYARANTGGRNQIGEVMATRNLLGAGKLTEEELSELDMQRRLFGNEFAEAVKTLDFMTEAQERTTEKRLGITKDRVPGRDGPSFSR
jgi:hypothetical protein